MGIEHEAAYSEALQRIRLAHQSGTGELCLADLALTCLPAELDELTGLTTLRVDGCVELRDLSSLRLCTCLAVLDLRACPQVIDLHPLQGLHTLRELRLGVRDWGVFYRDKELRSKLGNIEVLTDLTALETLTLAGCSRISDFQPLTALAALQHLDLSECGQLQALAPLAGLTALQHLSLSGCGQLQALSPLAGLTALQHLNLNWCGQLQALASLAGLTGLQHLSLSGCGQLQALASLAGLTGLQHLDLSGCGQLQTLPPLAGLTGLQHLNLSLCVQFQALPPLAGLTALRHLDLHGCRQLQALPPLAGLTGLQHLDLSGCEQLQDLQPLTALTQLKVFSYVDAGLLDCTPAAQPLASWGQLEELYAYRLLAAPAELGSSVGYDNALPRLRGWQQDLAAGEAPNSTLKLYMLGNGRVGKTQLCRRLCGEPFDPSIPSPHGVRLGQLRLTEARGDQPAVEAHFWDFDGQDVYLGTHALFLDERAIYVIAWNPQYEGLEKPQASAPQGAPQRH